MKTKYIDTLIKPLLYLLYLLCSLRFSGFTWGKSLTIQQQQTFPFLLKTEHFISEWYFTKNYEIGSLVVPWEKFKHRETHGRIVSLDHLRLGVEEQLLNFSASCLSPGQVKNLQKFINLCLKVGHSSNLKHSKFTSQEDNRPVTPVKCTKSAHRGTGTIYDSYDVLISGAFVWSRLIFERCLHLSDKFAYRSAHSNLFLTLRVIHKLKMWRKFIISVKFSLSR